MRPRFRPMLCFIFAILLLSGQSSLVSAEGGLQKYDEVYFGANSNLSKVDFSNQLELLKTLTFGTRTIWPSKMPKEFDPAAVLEYGKDPGLNVRKLQQQGYTGKGAVIAYVDQPLLTTHKELANVKLHYLTVQSEANKAGLSGTMHGPAVLSLLAGKDIGIAPDAEVYFVGHPAWLMDQTTHAEAIRMLIKENAKLPPEKKFKIIGFSDSVDPREKNAEEFRKAIQEAEQSGIKILDVDTFGSILTGTTGFADKNNINNYEVDQRVNDYEGRTSGTLYVPANGRTTAVGNNGDNNEYVYWMTGGASWTVPYIEGVIALGLQADPQLDMNVALKYIKDSATPFRNGAMINPEGFVRMVEANKKTDLNNGRDYYYFLYNGAKIGAEDLAAIKTYARRFSNVDIVLKDVSGLTSAPEIYQQLSQEKSNRKGSLKGIQIFGSSAEVPAFDIAFKIQMQNEIDDAGRFKSDFFYSTFNTDINILKNDFSIYKAFNDKLKVDFTPDWKVVRLPLAQGEIAPFITKYLDFSETVNESEQLPLVNFSNPIFAQSNHSDDMGTFITDRLDKEFGLLKSSQYTLYGNHEGYYPVTTKSGPFTQSNLSAENKKQVANIFINSHGQENNIDQAIFTSSSPASEKRISFINSSNINTLLSSNYYSLTTWTCNNAWNLGTNNLIHTALASGKAINAFGASTIISNNGVHNDAKLEDMKANNFYYFQYEFFKALAQGKTRSDSFFAAQQAYSTEILKHTNLLGDGNYQFNLLNVLSYHNLGVIEYRTKRAVAAAPSTTPAVKPASTTATQKPAASAKPAATSKPASASKQSGDIQYREEISSPDLKITGFSYKLSKSDIVFTLKYESGKVRDLSFFDPPDGKDIMLRWMGGMKKGANTFTYTVPVDKFKKIASNEITMRLGFTERNFISFFKDQIQY